MANTAQITPEDISAMVQHWLGTPPEGYLGSPYGADLKALLQRPQADPRIFDEFMAKMRADLPILSVLPEGSVSVWMEPEGVDRLVIKVDVAGQIITAGGAQ